MRPWHRMNNFRIWKHLSKTVTLPQHNIVLKTRHGLHVPEFHAVWLAKLPRCSAAAPVIGICSLFVSTAVAFALVVVELVFAFECVQFVFNADIWRRRMLLRSCCMLCCFVLLQSLRISHVYKLVFTSAYMYVCVCLRHFVCEFRFHCGYNTKFFARLWQTINFGKQAAIVMVQTVSFKRRNI